ncbi:MAG: helix-hairpin-helix domain-containing protein [bacterium]|jgi:competence ComEA-like helix-hairpin-helix protein|nr:helix-hairpin-helix domain-containing protein [bacterium]
MQRSEIILTLVLAGLILAGTTYQTYRGGPKTAVVITHPRLPPFDATAELTIGAPSASLAPGFPLPVPTPASPTAQGFLRFINTASMADWVRLPGIGEKTAEKILAYRQQAGSFRACEELKEVSGIGEKKYQAIYEAVQAQSNLPTPAPPVWRTAPPVRSIAPAPNVRPLANKDLNQATLADLTAVSGIGDALGQAILKARAERGGFATWADVDQVPGIGTSRLASLREHFTLREKK